MEGNQVQSPPFFPPRERQSERQHLSLSLINSTGQSTSSNLSLSLRRAQKKKPMERQRGIEIHPVDMNLYTERHTHTNYDGGEITRKERGGCVAAGGPNLTKNKKCPLHVKSNLFF